MRVQFLSFAIVLGIGLLLLVSMLASTFLIAFNHFIDPLPQILQDRFPQFNFGVAFAMSAIFFAIIFKFLPDARIAWRDVLVGAAVTSLLFTTGELLIGRYLGRVNLSQGYGAASSLILILLWVYLSMQIILLGAKFTQVYANHHGSKVVPSQRAEIIVRQRINHHHK
jgi:membrane protein